MKVKAMPEFDDGLDPELKALDDRLKKARSQDKPAAEEKDIPVSPAGAAWKLGIELVIAVVVGLMLGLAIDDWFDTRPVGMLVLIFLGFIAGVRNVIREAQAMQTAAETNSADKEK